MSKNRLTSLLPVRFATWLLVLLLLVCVSVLPALADESSDAVSAETTESVSAEASADASAEASTDASADTSATESEESETSETESAEASTAASETASETGSTPAASDTSETDETESESKVPWKLIITVAVIVILVAVLFILAKTNSKLGQKIAKFFKDYKSELAKVSWMPRNELVRSTLVVLVVLLVAAVAIGLLDFAFSSLVKLLSSIG